MTAPTPIQRNFTHETGALRTGDNGNSQFIGSSSGIYFINTVRRAFASRSTDRQTAEGKVTPENWIVGDEENDTGVEEDTEQKTDYNLGFSNNLGVPPSQGMSKQLIMLYFQNWHPLFPFLHGPSFMKEVEKFFARTGREKRSKKSFEQLDLTRALTFQCVFNIASLEGPEIPARSRIQSPTHVLHTLGYLAGKSNIETIQALLAAQLYCVAKMSLHTASTIGGLITRALVHAGLHRCPQRYPQLSEQDCEIRKRVFWSAFAIDRYLSQALGLPLGIHDSDIDVCDPGEELHKAEPDLSQSQMQHQTAYGMQEAFPTSTQPTSSESSPHPMFLVVEAETASENAVNKGSSSDIGDSEVRRRDRQSILAHIVLHSRLTGQILEIFHKSIHMRTADADRLLHLDADIDGWWNALPETFRAHPQEKNQSGDIGTHFDLTAFFSILYRQLILLLNRPWLSLEPTSPRFRAAIQKCIGASKIIISDLKRQTELGHTIYWPGYLSALWMSGLMLSFACQLDVYALKTAQRDITTCVVLLTKMAVRWPMAKHCCAVLSAVLDALEEPKQQPKNHHVAKYDTSQKMAHLRHNVADSEDVEMPSKRQKLSNDSNSTSTEIGNEQLNQNFTTAVLPHPNAQMYDLAHFNNTTNYTMIPQDPSPQGDNILMDPMLTGWESGAFDLFQGATWDLMNVMDDQ